MHLSETSKQDPATSKPKSKRQRSTEDVTLSQSSSDTNEEASPFPKRKKRSIKTSARRQLFSNSPDDSTLGATPFSDDEQAQWVYEGELLDQEHIEEERDGDIDEKDCDHEESNIPQFYDFNNVSPALKVEDFLSMEAECSDGSSDESEDESDAGSLIDFIDDSPLTP